MQGIIIKGVGGSYQVRCAEKDYNCHAKGLLRYNKLKPLVGDHVEIDILDEEKSTANMVRILTRKNELIRPAVANIDQAIIEFAVRDPEPNLNLLDRFLLFMDTKDIPVIIVLNKIDLAEPEEINRIKDIYTDIGYQVLTVSTKDDIGIDEIKAVTKGKVTVWAGPSGVGKSSLINMLSPEESMETGDLSQKIMRGKNTTRHTQLLCCEADTYVCDTPGFSSIEVFESEPDKVKEHFSEFYRLEPCKFADCRHISEPGCSVKQALSEGKISESRYENYVLFYKDVDSRKLY